MTRQRAAEAGFTLLELVAVLAIFALVALIGVQVIQATVRTGERLTAASEQTEALALTLALLRQDLDAAIPLPFRPAAGGEVPALQLAPGTIGLSRGGLAPLSQDATGLGRVTWRLEPGSGRLTRLVTPTLNPAASGGEAAPMLDGVRALEIFAFDRRAGRWRPAADSALIDPDRAPVGLRVRLVHQRWGPLDTVVSLR